MRRRGNAHRLEQSSRPSQVRSALTPGKQHRQKRPCAGRCAGPSKMRIADQTVTRHGICALLPARRRAGGSPAQATAPSVAVKAPSTTRALHPMEPPGSVISAYKVGTNGSGKATANTTARTLYVLPALSRLSERRNSAQRNQQRPVAPSNTSASGEHPGEDVTSKFSITSARNGALVC